jgi:DNA-directed RNA polymerase specialized sigma24 family protein
MPVVQREVLALLLEGLGAREIAEVLGTSENSIGIRLTRARKALRERLGAGGAS